MYVCVCDINIVKMSLLSEVMGLHAIHIKILTSFFTEMANNILKVHVEHRRPQIDKEILNRKNNAGGTVIPVVETNYNPLWAVSRHDYLLVIKRSNASKDVKREAGSLTQHNLN